MSKRVFYKTDGVIHAIKYTHDDNTSASSDVRTRWAYILLNEEEVNRYIGKDNKQDLQTQLDIIKNKYTPSIIKAIKEEEKKAYHFLSLHDDSYPIDNKLVYCTSALNLHTKLGYYSMLKKSGFTEEANKLGKPNTSNKLENVSGLYFDAKKVQKKLNYEYMKLSKTSNQEEYIKSSMIIAIPYVYNFEDNNNINSKLIATVIESEATASTISKYDIKGHWCDENKNPIDKLLLKDIKEAYYLIQTKNIDDGTIAELTILDKDMMIDDNIAKIDFTINDNEAHIHIDFDTIKFNLLKAFRDEEFLRNQLDKLLNDVQMKIELTAKIKIKRPSIRKKFEKSKLSVSPEYLKVGTRAIQNVPTPNSFPSEVIPMRTFVGVIAKAGELLLDKYNLEPIHEQISFIDNKNIGFTSIQIQNYGQVKTDEEMTQKDTIEAINDYSWNYYYCDEDTMKEAVYQTINEYEYSSSEQIHEMNLNDIDRLKEKEGREGKQQGVTEFTRINSLSPKDARKYNLLKDNCQDFIYRILQKYQSIEKTLIKDEKLGVYEKQEGKGIAPMNFSMGAF